MSTDKKKLLKIIEEDLNSRTEEEERRIYEAALSDPDNPPLTREELAAMRPARGRPRLPDDQAKKRVTMMLDPDVIEHFKADGKGWQTRVNAALRKAAGLD